MNRDNVKSTIDVPESMLLQIAKSGFSDLVLLLRGNGVFRRPLKALGPALHLDEDERIILSRNNVYFTKGTGIISSDNLKSEGLQVSCGKFFAPVAKVFLIPALSPKRFFQSGYKGRKFH